MDTRHGILQLSDIKMLARQCEQLKTPSIWLSGSEPLMHPEICDILQAFGDIKPLDFWIVTNGLLLSDRVIETIMNCGLTWLSISIDAATNETYKKIRGADLDIVNQNIEKFLRIRDQRKTAIPFLRVSFVSMPENVHEVDAFLAQWKDKADIIDIQTLANYHGLDDISTEDAKKSAFQCTAPYTLINVVPSVDIIPCCNSFYFENDNKYNIHNTSIEEYWNSIDRTEFALSVKNKDYTEECLKCVKSFMTH